MFKRLPHLHSTHFFMRAAQDWQATMQLHGLKRTGAAMGSEHTAHSLPTPASRRSSTYSRHSRHFFTRSEQPVQRITQSESKL